MSAKFSFLSSIDYALILLECVLFVFSFLDNIIGKTFRYYAIGEERIHWVPFLISLIVYRLNLGALYVSCSIENLLHPIMAMVAYWFVAYSIMPVLKKHMHTLSLAQSMGIIYGPVVRILVSWSGIICEVMYLSWSLLVLHRFFDEYFELEDNISLLIIAIIILTHIIKGGMLSIIGKACMVFVMMVMGIYVIICKIFVHDVENLYYIVQFFEVLKLEIIRVDLDYEIPLLIMYMLPYLSPLEYQFFLSSAQKKKKPKLYFYAGIIIFLIKLVVILLLFIITNTKSYLSYYPYFTILLLLFLLIQVDMRIHMISVLTVNDLFREFFNNKINLDLIAFGKVLGVILAFVSLGFMWVFINNTYILIHYIYIAGQIYYVTAMIPLIMSALKFKASKLAFSIGSVINIGLVFLLKIIYFDLCIGFIVLTIVGPGMILYINHKLIPVFKRHN